MLTIVRDILEEKGDEVWSVSPKTTILDAMKIMSDKKIGNLLVLENDQIAGIVSERDFVRMIAKESTCKFDAPVSVVMTRQVFTVDPSQSIEDCMIMMTEKRIRHLPVVENDQIVGMISIGDVIKGIINSQKFTIDQLTKYIGGGYNQ